MESISLNKSVDLSTENPKEHDVCNPVMARQDRGIAKREKIGMGIVEVRHT